MIRIIKWMMIIQWVVMLGLVNAEAKTSSKVASANPSNVDQALNKFTTACIGQASMKAKSEAERNQICNCIRRNFAKKLNEKQILLLAEVYSDAPGAEAKLDLEENEHLAEFDESVATKCLENPMWNIK